DDQASARLTEGHGAGRIRQVRRILRAEPADQARRGRVSHRGAVEQRRIEADELDYYDVAVADPTRLEVGAAAGVVPAAHVEAIRSAFLGVVVREIDRTGGLLSAATVQ